MPLSFEADTGRRPIRLPTLLLHPLKPSPPEDSHFEPEREEYFEQLLAAPAGNGAGHYGAVLGDPITYGATLRFSF